jgi:hypothetical protein
MHGNNFVVLYLETMSKRSATILCFSKIKVNSEEMHLDTLPGFPSSHQKIYTLKKPGPQYIANPDIENSIFVKHAGPNHKIDRKLV